MQKMGIDVTTLRQSKKAEMERTLGRKGITNELRRAVENDPRKYLYMTDVLAFSKDPKVRGNAIRLSDQLWDVAKAERAASKSKGQIDAAKNRKLGEPLAEQPQKTQETGMKPKESEFRGFDLDSPSGKAADEFFNKQAGTGKGRKKSEYLGNGLDGKPKDNGGEWGIF